MASASLKDDILTWPANHSEKCNLCIRQGRGCKFSLSAYLYTPNPCRSAPRKMKFSKYSFHPELHRNIQESGFTRPTDIQFKAIPSILKGEDVLAIAQTGTGKTAAYAIPVIQRLQELKPGPMLAGVKVVVMVPTRELARQVEEVFIALARRLSVRILSIHGGVEQDPQIASLLSGVDILVATPGRLFDLHSQGFLKMETLRILILDEADHMLDKGFIADIRQLIHFIPEKRQTLFFSATINPEIKKLAYSLVKNPIRIQLSPRDPVAKNVDHSVAHIAMDDKRFFLERLIREHFESKVLVFVRTRVRAERVSAALLRVGIENLTIHGDKEQQQRFEVLGKFRQGKVRVLIATDVSARGIDIPLVEYVVNYDLPEKVENYVHRIGRTGRGNKRGYAVSFCSPEEKDYLAEITAFIGKEIKELEIDRSTYGETLDLSEAAPHDWKSLLLEEELAQASRKKRKKR